MKAIYIHKDGQQLGPFTEKQIQGRLYSEEVSREDLAWHEGLEGWKPLRDILGAATPPPLPVHKSTAKIEIDQQPAPVRTSVLPTNPKPNAANNDPTPIPKKPVKRALKLIGTSLFLLLALIVAWSIATGGDSKTGNRSKAPKVDLPQDPAGHKVVYGRFKILQVVSPGRALAIEVADPTYGGRPSDQVYLLRGLPASIVDDESWEGEYFEEGRFTYTTTGNVSKTVRVYIVSSQLSEKAAQRRRENAAIAPFMNR